jgi:hypothetical protein
MTFNKKLNDAIALGLRCVSCNTEEYEERVLELYRSMLEFSDLPIEGSDSDRIEELKKRFLVYWTYEALSASTPEDADDWQVYMDQVQDSPGFLDSENVELMIYEIERGYFEGKICKPSGCFNDRLYLPQLVATSPLPIGRSSNSVFEALLDAGY